METGPKFPALWVREHPDNMEAGTPVPWTKPEDLTFEKGKPMPAIGGLFEGFVTVAWADGAVKQFRTPIQGSTLEAMITRGGGEPLQLPDVAK